MKKSSTPSRYHTAASHGPHRLQSRIARLLLLLLLTLKSTQVVHAELWTPVGEVDWTEGALTGQSSSWNQTWKVTVERSDSRPGVFRLQPYATNSPLPFNYTRHDNVYVYLHTEDPHKVYLEYYVYYYYSYHYVTFYYYHVLQRCPENGYDVQYYGKITDGNAIEFPVGSFAVVSETSNTPIDASYPDAKYSTSIHRIVFPDGVLGYTPPAETWVPVGTGRFTDPFFTASGTGEAAETDIEVQKSMTRNDVYKFQLPYSPTPLCLHAKNPDKVFLETYQAMNADNIMLTLAQQCTENGSTASQYGTLQNGVVEIPSEYFRISDGSTEKMLEAGRYCRIILPEGYSQPVDGDHGIYMGVVSFNDQLGNKPITLLNEATREELTQFVDNLQMGNATLLYYAVDQAITTMETGTYPDNLQNAYLITFTDGLDQGSLAMAPEHRTSRGYAEYLANRIVCTSIQGHPLQAYAIGLKSKDVLDDEMFALNLESLASPGKAHSVADIAGVQAELSRLYDELDQQTSQRVISIMVPMMSHGDTYRFTLDHTTENAAQSGTWIEGTFDIDDFSLTNVTYHGLTSASGTKVTGERNGVYLRFSFEDCRDTNGNILDVEKEDIDQWTYVAASDNWAHNVENDKDGKIDIEDIQTSSAIMFALDCSSSLDDLFPTLKETAKLFIRRLAGDKDAPGTGIARPGDDDNGITRYYNLQGIEVIKPQRGIFIEVKGGRSRKVYLR